MRILSQIPSKSEFTMAMTKSGREYLLLVSKSTYRFPETEFEQPDFSQHQDELIQADEYSGEPGYSAPIRETDFAFRKSKCDVVANGAAYAPNGVPAERVRVGIRVGRMVKQFDVVGQRHWRIIGPHVSATRPLPFVRTEFSYDTAFGGADQRDPEDPAPEVYDKNPIGRGFATLGKIDSLAGHQLPNTEEAGATITSPFRSYEPMALGPVGRAWPLRRTYAGTYDQNWIDNVFPFLPDDFDERYFQMAPEDQQIDLPQEGTEVVIVGMTPSGREAFRLPQTQLPIRVFRGRETVFHEDVLPDTIYLSPETRSFSMTWRIQIPIQRDIIEFTDAWIGAPTEAMLKAHREGRTYIRDVSTRASEEMS